MHLRIRTRLAPRFGEGFVVPRRNGDRYVCGMAIRITFSDTIPDHLVDESELSHRVSKRLCHENCNRNMRELQSQLARRFGPAGDRPLVVQGQGKSKTVDGQAVMAGSRYESELNGREQE